jgi:hypothetical protein
MRRKQLHKASGPLQVDHALELLDVRLQNRKQIWRIFKPPLNGSPFIYAGYVVDVFDLQIGNSSFI